jgi:hypothetical protein
MPYVRAWADNSRQSLLRLTTSAAPSTPALLFVVPSFGVSRPHDELEPARSP